MDISPDGSLLAAAGGNEIVILDAATLTERRRLEGHSDGVRVHPLLTQRRAARIRLRRPNRHRVGRRHRRTPRAADGPRRSGVGCRLQPRQRHAVHRRPGRRPAHLGPRRQTVDSSPAGRSPNRRRRPPARLPLPTATPWPIWAASTRLAVRRPRNRPSRPPHRHRPWPLGLVRRGGPTGAATPPPAMTGSSASGTGTPDSSSPNVTSHPCTSGLELHPRRQAPRGRRTRRAPPTPSTPRRSNPTARPSSSISTMQNVFASPDNHTAIVLTDGPLLAGRPRQRPGASTTARPRARLRRVLARRPPLRGRRPPATCACSTSRPANGPGRRGRAHTGTIFSVNYAPDGATFATGADDGAIVIWDADDRRSAEQGVPGTTDRWIDESDVPRRRTHGADHLAPRERPSTPWTPTRTLDRRRLRHRRPQPHTDEWTDAFDDRPYRTTCPQSNAE